jgi:hypothetical protein
MSLSMLGGGPITPLDMMISDEQVRLALRDLHNNEHSEGTAPDVSVAEVPAELLRRVSDSLASMPECRVDRVAKARVDLAEGRFSAHEVAGKIIGRVISDSLR